MKDALVSRLTRLNTPGFHMTMASLWALLLLPTLIWWKSSILWVAAMSLYANFIGHWSAYQAARAERTADRAEDRADGCADGRAGGTAPERG